MGAAIWLGWRVVCGRCSSWCPVAPDLRVRRPLLVHPLPPLRACALVALAAGFRAGPTCAGEGEVEGVPGSTATGSAPFRGKLGVLCSPLVACVGGRRCARSWILRRFGRVWLLEKSLQKLMLMPVTAAPFLVSFTSLGALLRSPVHPNPSRVSPGVSPRSCFARSDDDGVSFVATSLEASSWRPWLLVISDGLRGWRLSVECG